MFISRAILASKPTWIKLASWRTNKVTSKPSLVDVYICPKLIHAMVNVDSMPNAQRLMRRCKAQPQIL